MSETESISTNNESETTNQSTNNTKSTEKVPEKDEKSTETSTCAKTQTEKYCIFVMQPPECSACLDSLKLQCLLNHTSHKVSVKGKQQLRKLLRIEIGDKGRTRITARKE
jgi:hypothetical protein